MIEHTNPTLTLGRSIELPCGANFKNRLAKSPMSDSLADGEGDPTKEQIRLYERWAQGGTAVSFIGEVQGDPRFPERHFYFLHSAWRFVRNLAIDRRQPETRNARFLWFEILRKEHSYPDRIDLRKKRSTG